MTGLIIIILIIASVVYLPRYFRMQKLKPLIDSGVREGLSVEAITILLVRDATRSLGRVLNTSDVGKIKRIVASRVASAGGNVPANKTTDIEDVFRYINQTASPFLLQKGENIILTIPAVGLREPRSVRTTKSNYGGPSVRVAKGVYVHAGTSRSTSSSHEELKDIDGGDLIITNQRIFFAGKKRTANAPFKKIVSIEPYSNSIVLHKDGRERAQYFIWPENFLMISGVMVHNLIAKEINSN